MRTNSEGKNETLTFRLSYENRFHAHDYLIAFCEEHGISTSALKGKVDAIMQQFGVANLPMDGVSSSDAMFSILNAYPNDLTVSTSVLDDNMKKPIYFLGFNLMNGRDFTNPHIDRVLLSNEHRKMLRQSVIPAHVRGQYSALSYLLH